MKPKGNANMNVKKTVAALALGCALHFGIVAQVVEQPIFTIENGYSAGYNVGTSTIGSAFDITMGFGISENLQAQVSFIQGDGVHFNNYRLFALAYAIAPKLGITTLVGMDTTAATSIAGIGLYSKLLTRVISGSLQTGLKLRLEYLAPVTNYSGGVIRLGLSAGLGM